MTDRPPTKSRPRLEAAVDRSRAVAVVRTLADATDRSASIRVHRRLASVVTRSRLVRWFLASPRSERAVLDLRRARTVRWALPPLSDLLRRASSARSRLKPGRTAPLARAVVNSSAAAAFAAFLRPPPRREDTDRSMEGERR